MKILLAVAVAASVTLPLACAPYEHEVEMAVNDPSKVWVESPKSADTVEPRALGEETRIPGTRDTMERERDGAIRVNGTTVVGHDGDVVAPDTLAATERTDGVFRTPVMVCRRHRGCRTAAWLATPMANVRALAERDVPSDKAGWLMLVSGALAGGAGALVQAGPDSAYESGGKLLIGLGAAAALIGAVELLSDPGPKNERIVVDPDTTAP